MGDKLKTLEQHSFVRIVNIEVALLQERIDQTKKLQEYKDKIGKQIDDFVAANLSDNSSMLKHLRENGGLLKLPISAGTGEFSSVLLTLSHCVGRIVQVTGVPQTNEAGETIAAFSPKAFGTILLNTGTMHIEAAQEEEIQEYKPFHIGQHVQLISPEGIKYQNSSVLNGHVTVYPDTDDVDEQKKNNLFDLLTRFDLEVWLVEPTEKRVLVTTGVGSRPEIAIYVNPKYLQILD